MKKEDSSTKLEHLWETFGDMETDFPESKRPIYWRAEKTVEEAHELREVAHNDPDSKQWLDIVKENADVLLTSFWLFRELGITPEMALNYVLAKCIEVRQRFETGHYDIHPSLKPVTMNWGEEYRPPFFDDQLE